MNNLSSYCGLVDARISASEKDLPVRAKLLPNLSRDKKYHQTITAQPCRLKDVSVLFFLWFQEIMFNAVIISFAKMSFK